MSLVRQGYWLRITVANLFRQNQISGIVNIQTEKRRCLPCGKTQDMMTREKLFIMCAL